ncbi:MAG: helix-turn-helix transcriptional regulator [Clostridiales bacterium]|nr:helix-turn-helix transcriptional regulator [Clostridiales bacterium]
MSNIQRSIKRLRGEKRMTQEQLAQRISVTRQAVSNWETGKTQPDIETLEMLASVFETDIEELIYNRKINAEIRCTKKYKMGLLISTAVLVLLILSSAVLTPIAKEIRSTQYVVLPYYLIKCLLDPLSFMTLGSTCMFLISIFADVSIKSKRIRITLLVFGAVLLVGMFAVPMLHLCGFAVPMFYHIWVLGSDVPISLMLYPIPTILIYLGLNREARGRNKCIRQ